MSATFAAPTTPPSAVKVAAADAAAGYTQEDPAYSAAQEPPSPCPSASGSELSFTSETDASSATDLTTPPTSPTRATAQQFRKGSAGSQASAELASAQQPPPLDSQAIASSPSLDGLLASLSIDGGAAQNQAQAQAKLDAFFGSSVAGRRPSPPAVFVTVGPLVASQTSSRARACARPTSTQSPSPSTVPNAKRARPGPGTIDLSSLPRFPIVQQAAACTPDQSQDEHAPSGGLQSTMGLLTPHAAAGPDEGVLERTGSASSSRTPRALPERPGLLSRWSSDSESSRNSSGSGSGSGSCNSEDCKECLIASGQLGAASDDDDDDIDNDDSEASEAAEAYCQNAARRASADTEFEYDNILSPLPASPSAMPPASRRLGCNATMSPDWMQLPPAPKPHQHGFSPFWEVPSHNSTPTLPSTSQADLSLSLSGESSGGSGASHRRRGRKHGSCAKHGNGNGLGFSSSSGASSPSSDASSPASSPGFDVPLRSRTAGKAGSGSGSGSGPLTRSQGLRIRDEGSRAMRGRYARSLSAHAAPGGTGTGSGSGTSGAGGAGRESDIMRTASALLGGTISPAATTTDPLRVRLREMPGAITPDSLPSSPAALALGHHGQVKAPAVQHHYQLPAHNYSHSHNHNAHWLASVGRLPSSPLHISSLPDESGSDEDEADDDDGSEEGRRQAMNAAHRQRDTKHDIFSSSFSLAAPCPPHHHHNHYARGPSPLASPCAVLTRSSGADTDADADTDKGSTGSTTGQSATHASAAAASASSWPPAAAGRAGKTNPYFAGFV